MSLRFPLGFETTYCENGKVALDLAKEESFDFILIDYRMPGMDGAQIARAMCLQCPEAFIIGLSGENKRKEFIAAGANVFFSKPLPFPVLASLVEKIDAISQRFK